MARTKATGRCEGCHRRARAQHAGCTCPSCGGPKHHQALRCGRCARTTGSGRLRLEESAVVEEFPRTRPVYWLHCVWCGRESSATVAPTRAMRCGACGGNVLLEPAEWP